MILFTQNISTTFLTILQSVTQQALIFLLLHISQILVTLGHFKVAKTCDNKGIKASSTDF